MWQANVAGTARVMEAVTEAKAGGMAAVCDMEHWKERIAARPAQLREETP